MKTSGTPLAELERLHDRSLVGNSLKAWQGLTKKALEKEKEIMEIVIDIGISLRSMACTDENRRRHRRGSVRQSDREIKSLEVRVSESVAEYFARVHFILMKLARHKVATPAREIKRTVLGSLTSRFSDDVRLYAIKGETLDLKDLENELDRVESFQSDQERKNALAHALAIAHAGSDRTWGGGGARGRGW